MGIIGCSNQKVAAAVFVCTEMIEIKGLVKKFGDFTAVDGLDLRIETGEFFGLLGPNGAGKTTTISMLSTVLLPTSGEILIDGQRLDRKASSKKEWRRPSGA